MNFNLSISGMALKSRDAANASTHGVGMKLPGFSKPGV
jgi:hypothetical protein